MTIDDQSPRLQTVSDHLKWEAKYQAVLELANRERNEKLDDGEAARLARAIDAIITELRQKQKNGYSRDEAGNLMVYDGNVKIVGRLPYTPSDLLKVLQALQIDWRVAPRREPIFWGPRRG